MAFSSAHLSHVLRNLKQRVFKPSVGIIGGYHGGNLGDIALGESVATVLRQQGISAGLQTIYNLDKWPKTDIAILGGGAVAYSDSLGRVANRYKGNFNKVAMLGLDFNEKSYPQACIDLIKGASFVSCRSDDQANKLKALVGRKDVFSHPDIAFSLMNDFCLERRKSLGKDKSGSKKMLLNLVPLYGKFNNGVFVASEQYKQERPELYENFDQMQNSYKTVVRTLVEEALNAGYTIENIPFTPADKTYGEYILNGLPVKHLEYNSDPIAMIKYMATADWVVPTRFHATIFALKLGLKVTPFAYAKKNELMLQGVGIEREKFLSTTDLAKGVSVPLPPVTPDYDKVLLAEQESLQAIKNCISKVNGNRGK